MATRGAVVEVVSHCSTDTAAWYSASANHAGRSGMLCTLVMGLLTVAVVVTADRQATTCSRHAGLMKRCRGEDLSCTRSWGYLHGA